jgi:hypothetical protein
VADSVSENPLLAAPGGSNTDLAMSKSLSREVWVIDPLSGKFRRSAAGG